MRAIEQLSRFKRDIKREMKGMHRQTLRAQLDAIVKLLADDRPLPPHQRDHQLSGNWKGHRECHVHPDLLLIYRKPDAGTLQLVRLGSHSELGF